MINSTRLFNSPKQTSVLLSIKPPFVELIFDRKKLYEFRKKIFSKDVDIIVVYATMPIGRVVGEFDVAGVIKGPIQQLWYSTQYGAGITRGDFMEYFSGSNFGYAIQIGEVRSYTIPFDPVEELGLSPPQSFAYIEEVSTISVPINS